MFKLLKNIRKKDIILCLLNIVLVITSVYFELELISKMGQIIGYISANGQNGFVLTKSLLFDVGLQMILYSAIITLCTVAVNMFAAIISGNLSKKLRHKVYVKVNSFSSEQIHKFSNASLITRSTNDVKQVEQTVFLLFRLAISAPVMAIMAITKIVNSNLSLSLATAGAVVALFILVIFLFTVAVPKFSKIQKQTDGINRVTKETLSGLRVIRAFSAEGEQEEKFEKVNTDITKTNLFIARAMSFLMPGMTLILNGLNLGIYFLGATIFNKGGIDYATLSVFTQYSIQIIFSFMMVSMLFLQIPRGVVSAKRITEVLDTKNTIKNGSNENCDEIVEIKFNNVGFKYPDANESVLENINFTAKKGQTVAFIGSTGSGKSTLINLLPRFYDVTEGEILLNNINIKDFSKDSLNAKLGYVSQKPYLFKGTIKSNLSVANENATKNEMEEALKIAQAKFVFKNESGIDREISQGGTNVSGGQRQRICIARAIVKNPNIYIFDDSFSALDYKTDKSLRKALKKSTKDKIVFIVAQRVGTIIDADKIIVLDEGKAVGIGTHAELIKKCKIYRDIATSQLGKEGIKNVKK